LLPAIRHERTLARGQLRIVIGSWNLFASRFDIARSLLGIGVGLLAGRAVSSAKEE